MVSIIIPSYNSVQWVCNAVDCCLNQSHHKCEIIVVDDGSTDTTRDVLSQRYGDSIRYIYQENRGLPGARNTGLRHAKGDYIQFLDADDLIHTDKIRTQVEMMREMQSPAVTYTDYSHCDINDSRRLFPKRYMSPVMELTDSLAAIASDWETRLSIPVHCFLFDVAFFRQYGVRFDESLPNHEDWDCWMQIFKLKPSVAYLPEKMAFYCLRPDGICSDLSKMRDGFLKAIKKQRKIFANDLKMAALLDSKELEVRRYYQNHNPFSRILRRLPDPYRTVAQRIIPWRVQRIFD